MNEKQPIVSPTPSMSQQPPQPDGRKPKNRTALLIVIGVVVVAIIACSLFLLFKKKPATPVDKSGTTTTSQSPAASLSARLSKLDACSLISDPKILRANYLSVDPAGSMDTDDYKRPHCFFQSVVSNKLQYELETIIHLDKKRDPLAPTLHSISQQTTGKFKVENALGDYGDGRGTCNFIVTLSDSDSVEVDAVVPAKDDAFTPACETINYYGPLLVQQLTRDGF